MKNEVKIEKKIIDGTIKEIYDYVEINNEKIKHGLYKCYDYNGNLKEESFYQMGIKHGSAKEYSNGELKAEGNYENGKKVGEWKIKNYKGEIEKITFLEDTKDYEIYLKNKAIDKFKIIEILFSLAMVSIIIACIFQINSFFTEINKESEFPRQYEEKEIEKILEFPKKMNL